jgi:hypothetical protein
MTDIHTLEDHPLAATDTVDQRATDAGSTRRLALPLGRTGTTDWRQSAGFGAIGLGAIGIVVSWFQIAGEREIWKQLPYLASGGIGGAAAIAIGIALLIAFEHSADRAALDVVLDRLDGLDDRLQDRLVSDAHDIDLEHRIAELEAALRELRKPSRSTTLRTATGRSTTARNGR